MNGLKAIADHHISDCEDFLEHKGIISSKTPADEVIRNNWDLLDLVHKDVAGPVGISLFGKAM